VAGEGSLKMDGREPAAGKVSIAEQVPRERGEMALA